MFFDVFSFSREEKIALTLDFSRSSVHHLANFELIKNNSIDTYSKRLSSLFKDKFRWFSIAGYHNYTYGNFAKNEKGKKFKKRNNN